MIQMIMIQEILPKVFFFRKNSPFTNCFLKIKNVLIDNAEDLDVAMPMYNLFEYIINFVKQQGVYGALIEMKQLLMMR